MRSLASVIVKHLKLVLSPRNYHAPTYPTTEEITNKYPSFELVTRQDAHVPVAKPVLIKCKDAANNKQSTRIYTGALQW